MLGTPYAIRFPVQHGAGLGRTLGVPTINQIYPEGYQLPRYGIYITRTWIDGRAYPSATGLGTRPTVNDDATKVTCETFIPGFHGDLYGADPAVEFHRLPEPQQKIRYPGRAARLHPARRPPGRRIFPEIKSKPPTSYRRRVRLSKKSRPADMCGWTGHIQGNLPLRVCEAARPSAWFNTRSRVEY